MNSPNSSDDEFLTKLTEIIEANLTNPQFGVSMLAKEMGMSRSNLHRKVNEITKITVSQFINHVRLKKAKEILRHTSNTVSEVAYEVGFSNVSYFIKCFHQYYGYSPGQIGDREEMESITISSFRSKRKVIRIFIPIVVIGILIFSFYLAYKPFQGTKQNIEKTIAVLPAYYLASDSASSVIDGIAFAVYNNLELIQDLTVRPWISVRKYKNSTKNVFEISKELDVNYIVQFICQNYNQNDFSITITLINALENNTVPINTYKRTINDISAIEDEISQEVAGIIDAKITPTEKIRINKQPTENNKALRYFYEGLQKQNTNAESAVSLFEKAVEEDNKFALAYAELANTYSLLDTGINAGKYTSEINNFADKAILFDNENDKCLITKAKILAVQNNYELAINYLEKAVEYNPNSAISYRLLVNQTSLWGTADPEKCVEYALKAVKYNQLEEDSLLKSMDYFHLARALRQIGLFTEARKNIDIAISLMPEENEFFTEICDQIIDSSGNYILAIDSLKKKLIMAPNDYHLNHYLFKYYYHIRNFKNAYSFYDKLILNLHYQLGVKELSRLAVIYNHIGMPEKSDSCLELLEKRLNTDNRDRFYRTDQMMRLYCIKNDTSNAIKQFRIINQLKYITCDYIRLFKDEPVYEPLRRNPEFPKIISEMENKFREQKERIRKSMVAKGLM